MQGWWISYLVMLALWKCVRRFTTAIDCQIWIWLFELVRQDYLRYEFHFLLPQATSRLPSPSGPTLASA